MIFRFCDKCDSVELQAGQAQVLNDLAQFLRPSTDGFDNVILVGINADIARDGKRLFHDILRR